MKTLTLKSLVLAMGLTLSSMSANAAVTIGADENALPNAEQYTFTGSIVGASFDDYLSLSFLGIRELVGSVSATAAKEITFTSFDLVDSNHTTVLQAGVLGGAGPRLAFGFLESTNGLGDYFIHIAGTSVGGGSYAGTLSLTPVPEPEAYGMMLAGIGLIGFMARRRKVSLF